MAVKKNTKVTVKKDSAKPTALKQVTITAKKLPKQDSVSVGYGQGKQTFAKSDIKKAVKAGTLKADTTHHRAMQKSLGGNSDKAQNVSLAIKKSQLGKK